MEAITLTATHAATLRVVAAQAFPREACGLLVGRGEGIVTVTEVVPAPNVAADPARRFEIDPQIQFDLLRRLRGTEHRIVGHYHSHPNGAATLSAHDLAMALDPTAIWLVIPVDRGCAGSPRAFYCPSPERAEPIPIIDSGS